MLKTWIIALLVAFAAAAPLAAKEVDTGHILAELAPQGAATPGGTVYVALRQKIDKGWHTYWRNPGDSGEPPAIAWTLPQGWSAGDIIWPAPERLPVGPLLNYGYSGEVLLPIPVAVPLSAKTGETATLRAAVTFLVCADICIPEEAQLEARIPVVAGAPPVDARFGAAIADVLAKAPKPAGLNGVMKMEGASLKLAVTGPALKGANVADAYFFPFEGTLIDHAKPQAIERGPEGLTLTAAPGYAFQSGAPPRTADGVLVLGEQAFEVSLRQGELPAAAAGLRPPRTQSTAGLGLAGAALFAFLGGLILNLMPCVFPVLSMKAAALAGHAHEPRAARRNGVAFLAGVMATFLILAGVLITAQSAGAAVGWGFQLQSPAVVGALAMLMLAVALNLSGVFEIAGSLQNAGAGLASRTGLTGSVFTGVLAVVVAAPCTAPFMAGALGFALTQSAPVALIVFAALGLGFALPLTAAAFAPGLLRRLPRPGPWMDLFRQVLAFPMYGAAAWLAWVFALQAGHSGLALLLAAAVALGFAAWAFGGAQRARMHGRRGVGWGGAATAGMVAAVALVVVGARAAAPGGSGPDTGQAIAANYENFSPERLDALLAQGKPVLINFTAAWCVTCQVNERIALATPGFAKALERTGVTYLKADWTNRDPVIAGLLAEHGRAGVPLYLLYPAGSRQPRILPQLLTEGAVASALEAAAAPQT